MILFLKANERNLDFFVKIYIFSETISSSGTHCNLRYQTLFDPVSKINSRSWVDQFSNMMGYLGEFFQDLCGIPIESHWNYRGIQM